MIFRIFATLLLLAVIGGSLLLGRQQREAEAPAPVNRTANELGYGARDAQLIETGADGLPKYTLNAKRIEQHANDDSVELQDVHMTLNNVGGQRFTVDAERGDIVRAGTNIDLSGNVLVSGVLPGTDQAAQITSDRMSFDTSTDVASSADPVTFSWGGRQMHAVGISASLKDSHVQLESAVHGLFQP